MANRKVTLPSGAELEVQLAPFEDGKALYQALCEEGLAVRIDEGAMAVENGLKDIFLRIQCSKKVEASLHKCMARTRYNGTTINLKETFEPEEARGDYFQVLFEVACENVKPFTKPLLLKFSAQWERAKVVLNALVLKSTTKPPSSTTGS